jgi:GNAT superfamily N-acetyltransferase
MDIARIEIIERDVLADLFAAAPAELATAYGIAARRLNDGLLMINRRLDSIMFNRIMALGVLEPVRAETLDEGLAAFEAAGIRNWCVQVAPGTGSLGAMLTERGWSPRPRLWAKFAYPDGGPESFPTALDIREIGQADALAFGAVVAEAFGLPRETAGWIAALVGQPRWKVYAAFDGPVLVAGGALFIDGRTSWLGFGATKPEYRGRGGQGALLATRIKAAREAGCDLITTETGVPLPGELGPSYKNIQRVGFRVAYERPNFGPF